MLNPAAAQRTCISLRIKKNFSEVRTTTKKKWKKKTPSFLPLILKKDPSHGDDGVERPQRLLVGRQNSVSKQKKNTVKCPFFFAFGTTTTVDSFRTKPIRTESIAALFGNSLERRYENSVENLVREAEDEQKNEENKRKREKEKKKKKKKRKPVGVSTNSTRSAGAKINSTSLPFRRVQSHPASLWQNKKRNNEQKNKKNKQNKKRPIGRRTKKKKIRYLLVPRLNGVICKSARSGFVIAAFFLFLLNFQRLFFFLTKKNDYWFSFFFVHSSESGADAKRAKKNPTDDNSPLKKKSHNKKKE